MGLPQDVEIPKTKIRSENPLLVDEDAPVQQLRRWYQQFYVGATGVTAEAEMELQGKSDQLRQRSRPGVDWVSGTCRCLL